ncbi:MAG: phytoene/squalene synthase family protein [Planctomycetota bacterium]
MTRRRARNFYYGLKLSPEPQRSALYAVYAWMRQADDIVDGATDGPDAAKAALTAFRERTVATVQAGVEPDEPLWCALQNVTRTFRLDLSLLHDMLDGQLADLEWEPYESFEQLRRYCYQVAGTVALACIEIWGYADPAARELAIKRGVAFQLTNILRDYREDFDGDRVYLPASEFRDAGLTPQALRDWADPERCRTFVAQQVERAESLYAESMPLDDLITPTCRPTLWAMTRIYRNILHKVGQRPEQIVAARRLKLNGLHKGMIAIRARLQQRQQTREAVS